MAVKEEVQSIEELKAFIGRQTRIDRRKSFEKRFKIDEPVASVRSTCGIALWECILLGHNH